MKQFTPYLFALVLLFNFSCSSDSDGDSAVDPMNFDQKALFENLGTNLILPAYRNLSQKVNDLDLAVDDFIAAPDVQKLNTVKEKYMEAYLAWQPASFYEFNEAGAQKLAYSANTHPTNTERIEENIRNNTPPDDTFEKGFPALDYLLYGIAENEAQIVEKYNSDALAESRKMYLDGVVADLKRRIERSLAPWEGDYLQTFISNEGNSTGSSLTIFINAMLRRYEEDLKNSKFGIPAGAAPRAFETNPEMIEGLYSQTSKKLALANINAFIELFKGGEGVGLDDYLTEIKAKSANGNPLSEEIINQLNVAKGQIENLPEKPLNEIIEEDATPVAEIYRSIQQTVVYLKVDMTSALTIPVTYQDSDGD